MSEFVPRNDTENLIAIASALAGIHFSDYKNLTELDLAVSKRVSRSMRFLHKHSVPMRIASAYRMYAEITDVAFEESSQRYIVSFHKVGGTDTGEIESIRTDRIDGPSGELVKAYIGGDRSKLIGKHAFIYKLNETSSKGMGQTVRICPFIDVLD